MMTKMKLRVFRNPASQYTELYIYQLLPDGKVAHVESLNMVEVEPTQYSPPTLVMENDAAHELLQSLWDQGYRPANYQDESAMKAHLEDMRKIAFKFLELA